MERNGRAGAAQVIGRGLIALLWATAVYLVIYYTVLLYLGPDRLHALLGGELYNALIPVGGFSLVLLLVLLSVVWGAPLAVASAVVAGVLQLAFPRRSLRARLQIAGLTGLLATASLPIVLLDGWPDPLLAVVFGDDTEFVSTYSAWGFWTVRQGMTPEEVLTRVGPPLERYSLHRHPDQHGWRWTRSPHDSSYRIRAVVFENGSVAKKYSEFYLD